MFEGPERGRAEPFILAALETNEIFLISRNLLVLSVCLIGIS